MAAICVRLAATSVFPSGFKLASTESTFPRWLRRDFGGRLLRIFSSKASIPTGSCWKIIR